MPSTYFQSDIAALYNDDCLTLLDHLPAADLYLLDLPYGIALDSHGHGRQDRVYSIANDANGEFGEAVLDAIKGPTIAFASPKNRGLANGDSIWFGIKGLLSAVVEIPRRVGNRLGS